ncbi:MAG: site-specific integrase [Candidatus Ozemobacteraceae bacterium]
MFRNRLQKKQLLWYLKSPLKDRIDHAGKALLAKRYSEGVIQEYLNEWIRFGHWCSRKKQTTPTHLLSKGSKRYIRARFVGLPGSRHKFIRTALRILLEVDQGGNFARRITKILPDQSLLYRQWIPQHLSYLRHHRNLAVGTLRSRQASLEKFLNFLNKSGVEDAKALTPSLILDSFNHLEGWGSSARLHYASALRSFLKWGYAESIFPTDLSIAVMTARQYRDARLPEILTDDEVKKLLGSLDRQTALGRRDYAILLLAARYGLRPCDIRLLSLENIHWREGEILLTQEKTAYPLQLPLLAEIAAALIDYLKNGRPATESRNIFVRHLAPHEPFAHYNNLSNIMKRALAQAGMSDRKGLRGLYLFRHSLATRMLREGKRMTTIAAVLGHQDISSSFIYAKVNLSQLQTVAMSIAEV